MIEITDEQKIKAIAKKIDKLRKKVEGEYYYEPEAGDWLIYNNRIYLCYRADRQYIYFRGANAGPYSHEYHYPGDIANSKTICPIPSYLDCRALLRKMGYFLIIHNEKPSQKIISLWFWNKDASHTPWIDAPNDTEAIMLALLEALKRKVREQADKEGEDG